MATEEDIITNAICEYLELKRYYFWKVYNGGVFDASKKIYRKAPKWSVKGVSDLILICGGEIFFLEVKSRKGMQSEDQEKFEEHIVKNGGNYFIVRSIDDVQRIGL